MRLKYLTTTAVLCLVMTGCVLTPVPQAPIAKNDLTHGNVQMTLKKGVTTKAQVLEAFGAPNITTIDAENREVWTYQRHAQVSEATATESYGTIILFGGSSRAAGFEQSSRTMTLIIKFDQADTVYDFRSRSSSF